MAIDYTRAVNASDRDAGCARQCRADGDAGYNGLSQAEIVARAKIQLRGIAQPEGYFRPVPSRSPTRRTPERAPSLRSLAPRASFRPFARSVAGYPTMTLDVGSTAASWGNTRLRVALGAGFDGIDGPARQDAGHR